MLKSVAAVLRGTVVAQLINIALVPVLTRQFGPEQFGQFQLYQSCLVPILVVVTMRYEVAILQAEDEGELSATVHLCFGMTVLISGLVGLLGGLIVSALPGEGRLPPGFLPLLAAGSLFAGLFQAMGYVAVRFHEFRAGAISKIVQAGVGGLVSMIGGVWSGVPGVLQLGDVTGRFAGSLSFLPRGGSIRQSLLARPSVPRMASAARKFRALPLLSVPGGLINSAGAVVTPLAMYGYFSPAVAGQFGIVERCIVGPLGILGVAVSQVYMATLSKMARERTSGMLQMYRIILRKTLLIGAAIALPCAILVPYAVPAVFGPQWAMAGRFASLLAPLLLVTLAASALSMTLAVTGHQRLQLAWEAARLASMVSLWFAIAHFHISTDRAVAAHGIMATCLYLLYFLLAYQALRRIEPRAVRG